MLSPGISAHAAEEHMPHDYLGRIIYAMKLFGPTTIIACVLVWQSVQMTHALQAELRVMNVEMRQQTKQVISALENSTHAIEVFAEGNREIQRRLEENGKSLLQIKTSIN